MQINTTVSAWQCQWGRNSVICRSAKEEGSEREHGGGERSTVLSLHPFPSSPSSASDVLGNRASLWGEAWWMPFPRWIERIALSCTTLPGEGYTALGDSSIDYFYPSTEVPCKHTYISGSTMHMCAPDTHRRRGGSSEACLGPTRYFIIRFRLLPAHGHRQTTRQMQLMGN